MYSMTVHREGFLYTMIVQGGGLLLLLSRFGGGGGGADGSG